MVRPPDSHYWGCKYKWAYTHHNWVTANSTSLLVIIVIVAIAMISFVIIVLHHYLFSIY